MLLKILDVQGNAGEKTISVSDNIFGKKFNEPLVHQVVVAHMAKARAGTKAQKTRAEVRGGGKKPWRQKGTGRARAGTSRSPIWRKGGVIFAAKPRDYSQKVNKKMYRNAVCSILSELARQGKLTIIEPIHLEQPKTKLLISILKQYKLENTLIISNQTDDNLFLASRNIPNVCICEAACLDPHILTSFENVVIESSAIKAVEERFEEKAA